jgi:hypothetical protein
MGLSGAPSRHDRGVLIKQCRALDAIAVNTVDPSFARTSTAAIWLRVRVARVSSDLLAGAALTATGTGNSFASDPQDSRDSRAVSRGLTAKAH